MISTAVVISLFALLFWLIGAEMASRSIARMPYSSRVELLERPVSFTLTWPARLLEARAQREARYLKELSLKADLTLPEQDARVPWTWSVEAYEKVESLWIVDDRVGCTLYEVMMSCEHLEADITFDESAKATTGTIVRATCKKCGATTFALLDDWLDNRYKLSSRYRSCFTGLDRSVCGCSPCSVWREPKPVASDGYYNRGRYDS